MEYRRFKDDIVMRVDPGEEIIAKITEICDKEQINLANVTGLGAAGEVTLGIFGTKTKEYYSETYIGEYEISSLVGNISRKDGAPYLHLHATIGNVVKKECHGGHLSKAVISATGEIMIHIIGGAVGRELSDTIGLNLYKF
ncbi:MAG: DNA-binding protein [Lachnospiraceae bacterium]|nr:DNA-binding protein [Lachnospiraceae bacterium]